MTERITRKLNREALWDICEVLYEIDKRDLSETTEPEQEAHAKFRNSLWAAVGQYYKWYKEYYGA